MSPARWTEIGARWYPIAPDSTPGDRPDEFLTASPARVAYLIRFTADHTWSVEPLEVVVTHYETLSDALAAVASEGAS